ncbi:MAG: DUF4926 domain-containing protein [Rhizobacter sp.]|nr:DUF4926 domain-containing protein [Chlorobiales bacterium]
MKNYLVIVNKSEPDYSSHPSDRFGCIAAGDTLEEVLGLMESELEVPLKYAIEESDLYPDAMQRPQEEVLFSSAFRSPSCLANPYSDIDEPKPGLFETVSLRRDIAGTHFQKGDVGVIIHKHLNDAGYEVRFGNTESETTFVLTLTDGEIQPITGTQILHVREFA